MSEAAKILQLSSEHGMSGGRALYGHRICQTQILGGMQVIAQRLYIILSGRKRVLLMATHTYSASIAVKSFSTQIIRKFGTKHLTTHLDSRRCKEIREPVHSGQHHPPVTPQNRRIQRGFPRTPFSVQSFDKELVRVLIDGNWPFWTLERPSFLRLVQFLRPGTIVPNYIEIWNDARGPIWADHGTTSLWSRTINKIIYCPWCLNSWQSPQFPRH